MGFELTARLAIHRESLKVCALDLKAISTLKWNNFCIYEGSVAMITRRGKQEKKVIAL